VLAPRGTARDIVAAINKNVLQLLDLPDVKDHLVRQGAAAAGGSPEQFDAYIKRELARWSPIIRQAGLRPD